MQMPRPNKFHAKLEVLVGDWSGDETIHPTPWDPQGGKAKGRYRVRAGLGGFGVIQDYEQRRNGQPNYVGHGVLGYDAAARRYVWHWSDSMGGVTDAISHGAWKGNVLSFEHGGEQGHGRYAYTFFRDGSIGFTIHHSSDGKRWLPFLEGRYTKKNAAKKPARKKGAKKAR